MKKIIAAGIAGLTGLAIVFAFAVTSGDQASTAQQISDKQCSVEQCDKGAKTANVAECTGYETKVANVSDKECDYSSCSGNAEKASFASEASSCASKVENASYAEGDGCCASKTSEVKTADAGQNVDDATEIAAASN